MSVYLQVRAGPLHLMLSAEGIHEVSTLDQLGQSERGFVEWREAVLPLVSFAEFFELSARNEDTSIPRAETGQASGDPVVIYSTADEAPPIAFRLDEVIWLKNLPAHLWLSLPSLPARTAHFFDAIMGFPETGHQAYRLRRPLRPEDFRSAGGWLVAAQAVLEG